MHTYSKSYHGTSTVRVNVSSQWIQPTTVYLQLQSITFFNIQFGAPLITGPGKLFPLKFKAMHYPEVVGMTNNFLPGSSEIIIQYLFSGFLFHGKNVTYL